ncbi:MAG: hypothetical protein KC636_04860, partial [Myxococcales bacterium]|nr:hypothetical protein [Myxococcales bacterium]
AVHPQVKSPAMTGEWEHMLRRIERGEAGLERFMAGIADYVTGVVCDALGRPRPTGQVSQDMSMIDSIDSID